jgi:hypothetical protein
VNGKVIQEGIKQLDKGVSIELGSGSYQFSYPYSDESLIMKAEK